MAKESVYFITRVSHAFEGPDINLFLLELDRDRIRFMRERLALAVLLKEEHDVDMLADWETSGDFLESGDPEDILQDETNVALFNKIVEVFNNVGMGESLLISAPVGTAIEGISEYASVDAQRWTYYSNTKYMMCDAEAGVSVEAGPVTPAILEEALEMIRELEGRRR